MENKNFTSEQNAVMNAILEMTSAFHKKDINGVMASYEPQAVIVFEPEKPVSDHQAIREGVCGFLLLTHYLSIQGMKYSLMEVLPFTLLPG